MSVFIDTSAVLSILDGDDVLHAAADDQWATLLDNPVGLFTSNYVVLESMALVQRRLGMEALRILIRDIEPALQVIWVDRKIHDLATGALTAANRRQLSLVDMTSFVVMHQQDIDTAFTFDEHFSEHGFTVVPG